MTKNRRFNPFFRVCALVTAWAMGFTLITPPPAAQAKSTFELPVPGAMVTTSDGFVPPMLRGLRVDLERPFAFDFILDTGNANLDQLEVREEASKLIRYFLASLTIPENDLWVNLSPYENDRIIPTEFGVTEMGRDVLAQDYILKQLTASLMYPEEELGKEFWDKVYARAQQLYGTTDVSVNTFVKVWIVPDKALVYEHDDVAYVLESNFKVMLEKDYVAMRNNLRKKELGTDQLEELDVQELNEVSSEVIRDVVIPAIQHEVNTGENFARLRQIYHSLVLAKWYKERLKSSILNQSYADQKKVSGVDLSDKTVKEQIYRQYLEAFKVGVFDYIREEYDVTTQEMIPRKYFSGGLELRVPLQVTTDAARLSDTNPVGKLSWIQGVYRQPRSSPKSVNDFIRRQFRKGQVTVGAPLVLADGTERKTYYVNDLLANMGQLGHIGFVEKDEAGQAISGGQEVVFLDTEYADDATLRSHEALKVSRWTEKRESLGLSPEQMRGWLKDNLSEATQFLQQVDRDAERAFPVEPLYTAAEARGELPSNEDIAATYAESDDFQDLNLAAGRWGRRDPRTQAMLPNEPVLRATGEGETFDDILLREMAEQRGVSVNDLEADFQRNVTMMEDGLRHTGFIAPQDDEVSAQMHRVFDRLISAYQTLTDEAPGEFHMVDANSVNAFVIRKRSDVYFYKGLYETFAEVAQKLGRPLTEDIMAFIIAHELSHTLQHTSYLGLDIKDMYDKASPYMIQMIKNAEYDADMQALEMMDKAGFSVFGALDAMSFLEYISRTSQPEEVLSSHPYVSLRKNRLAQIIYDQATTVFSNVKAPRLPMTGTDRLTSRDIDFRFVANRTIDELLALAGDAQSVEAVDEAVGMATIRRGMNALKDVAAQDRIKQAFMRQVFVQAAQTAIGMQTSSFILSFTDRINFDKLELAGAVTAFGTASGAEGILPEEEISNIEQDLDGKLAEKLQDLSERMARRDTPTDSQKKSNALMTDLRSAYARSVGDLNAGSYAEFLLPRDQVTELIELFEKPIKEGGERRLRSAMRNPIALISAYFYARIIDQVPVEEIQIPTTAVQVRLQRRSNDLYLDNPRYRSLQSEEDRRDIQDVLLMQFVLSRSGVPVARPGGFQWRGLIGEQDFLRVSDADAQRIFEAYYSVYAKDYLPEIAAEMAAERVQRYTDRSVENRDFVTAVTQGPDSLSGLADQLKEAREGDATPQQLSALVETHPFITFARQAQLENPGRLGDIALEDLVTSLKTEEISTYGETYRALEQLRDAMKSLYEAQPRRRVAASEIFQRETGLNFRMAPNRVADLDTLEQLPDWAVSDYIGRERYSVSSMITGALDKGKPLSAVFDFMQTRLSFADRKAVFEGVFMGRPSEYTRALLNYFDTELNNAPEEVVLWFMTMFSSNDALGIMTAFGSDTLPRMAEASEDAAEQDDFKTLAISLLEFAYSQTSRSFQPDKDSAPAYLKLIRERIEARGGTPEQRRSAVHSAMMRLSGAVDLNLQFAPVRDVREDAPADFRTEETSIRPVLDEGITYAKYRSNFGLHHFGWNAFRPEQGDDQFVSELADMSVDQLRGLLGQRLRYLATQTSVEYRDETFTLSSSDDFLANFLTALILKKVGNPEWDSSAPATERLDQLITIDVTFYVHSQTQELSVGNIDSKLTIDQAEVNAIPFDQIRDNVIGAAIPSATLDKVWDRYVRQNNLEDRFPEFQPLLQNPNTGIDKSNPLGDYLNQTRGGQKVPYRQVLKKFFLESSVFADLFNAYVRRAGEGYTYGTYRNLEERLAWMESTLPGKSIIKDGIFDLWETDIFPEIVDDLPGLLAMARNAGQGEADLFTLLGEMDDDVGRLQRLNSELSVDAGRIDRLLDFYTTIIPRVFSPQKVARYGATAYLLWRQLPDSADLGLAEHLDALTKFMPEPSVLRDELLNTVASRYIRKLDDAQSVADLLYVNNLLSRNRDLRSEDFVSESVQHMFGGAEASDKRDVLLWVIGSREKPEFVADTENKYRVDFTSLPDDVRLLPATVRDRFIEGFMLGDNGVLDPRSEADLDVMRDLLTELFDSVFPVGVEGINETGRNMLRRVFRVVMEAYPAYKRVHVIKTLAELGFRSDFRLTSLGERLAVLLGVLGPVGIKVAQFLSENDTLVPNANLRSSLGSLRHQAPEVPKISAISVLRTEVPFADLLVAEIGDPRGIASIKQVNGGRWVDIDAVAGELTFRLPAGESAQIRAAREGLSRGDVTFAEFADIVLRRAAEINLDLNEATVPVVYKIRRPNMDATLGADYTALDAVAADMEGQSIRGKTISSVDELVETVKEWVELEKDFRNEAAFHEMISNLDYGWARTFAEEADVTIAHPRVYFATERLIVEEDVPGVPFLTLDERQNPIGLDDVLNAGYTLPKAREVFDHLQEEGSRRARILLGLYRAGYAEKDLNDLADEVESYDFNRIRGLLRQMLLRQIFVDGVFHADLHQGNVLFTPEGKLSMIDRGNVGRLNPAQIEGAKTLLKGVSLRQADLIKSGIDRIFLAAEHADGRTATFASITRDEIQDILDEGLDLKMTMSMIGARTVEGSARTQAEQDFSKFLKAFTQAIWLFPTDFTQGVDSLQAIAQYVEMDENEVVTAAEEQAKYFVVQDTSTPQSGRDSDLMRITKDILAERLGTTRNPFTRLLLRGVVFPLIRRSIRSAESDPTATSKRLVPLIRSMGPRVTQQNLQTLVELRNFELTEAAGEMLEVPMAESVATTYVETSLRGKGFGTRSIGLAMPIVRGMVNAGRPVTRVYLDILKEWLDSGGKRLIAGLAPRMTVGQAIDILAQIFPQDFSGIKQDFDRLAQDTPARLTQDQRQIRAVQNPPDIGRAETPDSDTQTGLISRAVGDRSVLSPNRQEEVGGIDLNPNLLELQIEGDRLELNVPIDTGTIEPVQIEGLLPVIINVTPITNLPLILGAAPSEPELYAAATSR